MGSTEKFCLKWNDFETNISHSFRELWEEKDFFDITLACDDENQISAHKVILSACSPFFRSVLRLHKHQHPLLYLKGIKHDDLSAILNFMYHGEVNVAQEDLNSFLAVAEELKVKGLTQTQQQKSPPDPGPPPSASKHSSKSKSQDSSLHESSQPPPKKSRSQPPPPPPPSSQYSSNDSDEIQEIIPVKSEHSPAVPITPSVSVVEGEVSTDQFSSVDQNFQQDFNQFGEGGYDDEGAYDSSMTDNNSTNIDTNKDVEEYMQCLNENGVESWQCLICYKVDKRRYRMLDHVDSIHLRKTQHICKICFKSYLTKNSLGTHISMYHKNEQPFDF